VIAVSIWRLFAKGLRADAPMRVRRNEVTRRQRRAAQASFFADPTYHTTRRLEASRD
jgi:hypothetical protein